MARTLEVTPSMLGTYTQDGMTGYRLKLEITAATDMPSAVFRYCVLPLVAGETVHRGEFDGVCRPDELESLAVDEPPEEADPMWCRTNFVDILLPSRHAQDEAEATIRAELTALIAALNATDRLEDLTPYEIL